MKAVMLILSLVAACYRDPTTAGDRQCRYLCTVDSDCCTTCKYPDNGTCEAGQCISHGCANDAECASVHGAKFVCVLLARFPTCVEKCAADSDCAAASSEACVGSDDSGGKYCEYLPEGGGLNPCGSGPECWQCRSDGDCQFSGDGVKCLVDTHTCGCADDVHCSGSQFANTLGGGRYVCR